ncbi:MAG: hypothetical protein H6742_21235 [Alphaproteobacteria bacterium]|nr:hypothetical protein [Alphaproteobacteria bacterium]
MTVIIALSLLACSPDEAGDGPSALGGGDLDNVTRTVIGTGGDGLNIPRDLGFNPDGQDELWVVNRADDSTVTYWDAGTAGQQAEHIVDPFALHFMEEVSSIAFGAPGTFGTCQESTNTYNGQYQGNNFMGPTLWSSDMDIYGQSNPEAVDYLTDLFGFYADLGSHLDMLHQTPLCMGIAWDHDNVYWVFDGKEGAIERNDFAVDHGPGYDDHSDGVIGTYVQGALARVEDVPSHLELDRDTGLLYIADTGNNRVAVLDTTTGARGDDRRAQEPGTDHYFVDGAELWTLVDGDSVGMQQPSGLALHDGVLYVGDHATGRIHAFDLDGNELVSLDTEAGGLMGIEVRGEDDVWFVDAEYDEVIRLQPAE